MKWLQKIGVMLSTSTQTFPARFPREVDAVLDSDHTKISGHPEGQFSITIHHV